MTEIAFHFNLIDKVGYACRLIRKAYARGKPVGVIAPDALLHQVDQQLWTFSALAFVPHCATGAPADVLAASPVVLATESAALGESDLMVHLGASVPAGFERFRRLIELVGVEVDDRAEARKRWHYYAERGYSVQSYDLAERSADHGK